MFTRIIFVPAELELLNWIFVLPYAALVIGFVETVINAVTSLFLSDFANFLF